MIKTRLVLVNYAFMFCFIITFIRLFYWQITTSSDLKKKAYSQSAKIETISPTRGSIYTSDNYPLVQNQHVYLLSVYKPNLKSPLTDIINRINQIKPPFIEDNQSLINNFSQDNNQKWLTFPTFFTQAESSLLNFPGLSFAKQSIRFFPEGNLGQIIIGKPAQSGLESYYDNQLSGQPGFNWLSQDASGKALLNNLSQLTFVPGRNIITSINRGIQFEVEKTLTEGIARYQADSGSITIMDPATGGIIAMASFSSTASATPSADSTNPIIFHLFEPGSIFKPLILASALDTKSISSDYICTNCSQPLKIGQYTITNWNNEIHPNSPLRDIIKNSDNIGMSNIIAKLGLKNFLDYYHRLELNQKSGIDLPSEAKPLVKTDWPDIDLATASFGQGIAITQIQMLKAFNAIADDGLLVRPKIAKSFIDGQTTIPIKNDPPKRVFDPKTIKMVKDILKYSVENGVVARLKPPNLEVCAKSGTAQVPVKGGYTDSQTIASYIGFSPCWQPKFTMIVTINNPKSSPWGSSTAAPIWFDIGQKISLLL